MAVSVQPRLAAIVPIWDRLKKQLFAKQFGENIAGFLVQNTACFYKILIITSTPERKQNFFKIYWYTLYLLVTFFWSYRNISTYDKSTPNISTDDISNIITQQ
jgi:hypothetical protein